MSLYSIKENIEISLECDKNSEEKTREIAIPKKVMILTSIDQLQAGEKQAKEIPETQNN